jgi:putative tricarboxylic transport membrane protein
MRNTNDGAPETLPRSPAELASRRARLSAVTACAVVLVGVLALVAARDLQYWTALGPGPGFFPRWLGGLLVLCGALWLVQLWRRSRDGQALAAEADPEETEPGQSPLTVTAIVVSLCVLAALLEVLGYQLAMLLFLLFHLLVLGRRGPVLSAVIAGLGSFGVFVVFTRFLTVPLPVASILFLRDLGL